MSVIKLGAYPVSPHHIGLYVQDGGGQGEDWWYDATLELMLRCDAVLMLPRWEASRGATNERSAAIGSGMPVFEDLAELTAWIHSVSNTS
jgi:hypothetical protein